MKHKTLGSSTIIDTNSAQIYIKYNFIKHFFFLFIDIIINIVVKFL